MIVWVLEKPLFSGQARQSIALFCPELQHTPCQGLPPCSSWGAAHMSSYRLQNQRNRALGCTAVSLSDRMRLLFERRYRSRSSNGSPLEYRWHRSSLDFYRLCCSWPAKAARPHQQRFESSHWLPLGSPSPQSLRLGTSSSSLLPRHAGPQLWPRQAIARFWPARYSALLQPRAAGGRCRCGLVGPPFLVTQSL